MDVIKRIKVMRLRWLGHLSRMESSAPARKVFESDPGGGRRRRGRPQVRWKDQVLGSLTTLGVTNWRQKAANRNEWRNIVKEATTCNRL